MSGEIGRDFSGVNKIRGHTYGLFEIKADRLEKVLESDPFQATISSSLPQRGKGSLVGHSNL